MNLLKNKPPERNNEGEVLKTIIETGNITIYSHGPTGVKGFQDYFYSLGFNHIQEAFIKPFHWEQITKTHVGRTHILVLRDPVEAHHHAAYLHAVSMRQGQQKRNNMFYNTHLQPYMPVILDSLFDFYIPYEKLQDFIPTYEYAPIPAYSEKGKLQLFDLQREINTYKLIKETKIELQPPQWRELLISGQLDEI